MLNEGIDEKFLRISSVDIISKLILVSLSQATQLQTRYMELLTLSGDYYKFLGELLKNMEELKVPMLYFAVAL